MAINVSTNPSKNGEEKVMPENQAPHIHTSAEYESCEECKSRATRETRGTPPDFKLERVLRDLISVLGYAQAYQWKTTLADGRVSELFGKAIVLSADEEALIRELYHAQAARVSQPVAPPPPMKQEVTATGLGIAYQPVDDSDCKHEAGYRYGEGRICAECGKEFPKAAEPVGTQPAPQLTNAWCCINCLKNPCGCAAKQDGL
jgi:hypothetical protein